MPENEVAGEAVLEQEKVDCDKQMNDTKNATKSARRRRASALAASTKKAQVPQSKSISEFVKFTIENIEFEMFALQAQLSFIKSLSEMSDDEKLQVIFDVLDKDEDGYLDARELSDGLRRTDENVSFSDSLEDAIAAVAVFDKDEDAKLNKAEFKSFLDSLTSEMGINFHEVSELLVIQMLFSDRNDAVEQKVGEIMKDEVDEAVKCRQTFNKALADERMMALFLLFDIDDNGFVDFKEVAIGLHRLLGDMEAAVHTAVSALIMFDEEDKRKLNYEQFAGLITNIVAATEGSLKFDDVADAITLASCEPDVVSEDELVMLAVADEAYNALQELNSIESDAAKVVDVLHIGRMQRLFLLMDLDQDGFISFEELTLAARKFHEAKDVEFALERATNIMINFDSDNDQKLNRAEFALFIVKLSEAMETEIHELIDFCIVCVALKDNVEMEKTYISSIGSEATEQIKMLQEKLDQAVFA